MMKMSESQRLRHLFLVILCACGETIAEEHDAAVDGGHDAVGDACVDVHQSCTEGNGVCCCFDHPYPCAAQSYDFDATFELCPEAGSDAEAGVNCVANDDCTNNYGALALACAAADEDSGDPYPDPGSIDCTIQDRDADFVNVSCQRYFVCGRKFDGLMDAAHVASSDVALAYAEMAWLESASVHAFSRLARDLEQHAAPQALVHAATRAAREEARHARLMRRIARAHGASARPVATRRRAARTLEAIATENAIEGCARETYGALVVLWQSHRARDREARRAFAEIAPDELGHAALAWEIARWAETRLSADAVARVHRARNAALLDLAQASAAPSREVGHHLGAPSAEQARKLAMALAQALCA